MSSWDILGGDGGDNNDNEEVEYVGVIEDDAPPVREPMRPERRNVRRVAPQQMPMDQAVHSIPQDYRRGAVGAPNRDEEDLVSYVDMPHGKQLGLTPEAIDRLQKAPVTSMNGQMSQRIEPGTYVMYGPSRADGLGALGQDKTAPATGGGAVYRSIPQPKQQQQQEEQSSLWGDLAGAIGGFGGSLATAIGAGAQHRREMDLARYQAEIEHEVASEAAQIGLQETMLQQQVQLAEIAAGSSQMEELQAQLAARQSGAPPVVSGGGGTSPVVWILVALLGVGGVGGIIYVASKKKK